MVSDRPKFMRALAWVRLVKAWACMRADDFQGVDPLRIDVDKSGLRLTIRRSKTTGPGKKHKIVWGYVARSASLTGNNWLDVGAELWKSWASHRDHFHLQPRSDLQGVTSLMASGEQVASYGRMVLQELAVPELCEGVWQELGQVLIPGGLPGHWTEHSERHFLPSFGAQAEVSDAERDLAGRWGLGKIQSRDYVLTAGAVSRKVQEKVATAIMAGSVFEDDITKNLEEKFPDEAAEFIEIADKIYKEVVEFHKVGVNKQVAEQDAAKSAEGKEGSSSQVPQDGDAAVDAAQDLARDAEAVGAEALGGEIQMNLPDPLGDALISSQLEAEASGVIADDHGDISPINTALGSAGFGEVDILEEMSVAPPAAAGPQTEYWISHSPKRGCRTLHRANVCGCWMRTFPHRREELIAPSPECCDALCLRCFPRGARGLWTKESKQVDSSSDEGSSSEAEV